MAKDTRPYEQPGRTRSISCAEPEWDLAPPRSFREETSDQMVSHQATSFASSIGIVGIASILALSNGFNMIAEFESVLSGFPIKITQQTEEVDGFYHGQG